MLFQYNSLLISHLIRCIAFFKHNYLLFLFFKNLDKPGKKNHLINYFFSKYSTKFPFIKLFLELFINK
jgi:hypothetical protein